jgi:hypothetical protein
MNTRLNKTKCIPNKIYKYNLDMSFYIFVNSNGYDLDENTVSSKEICSYRLNNNVYPLYHRTRMKNIIKANDSFIFYLAGRPLSETRKFVAFGKIDDVVLNKSYNEDNLHLSKSIEKIITLKSVVTKKSVSIYSIKDRLSFIPKKKKWGSSMQGGVIPISKEDFNLITKEMKK